MDIKKLTIQRVHKYYWDYDWNCATVMLKVLGEIYQYQIDKQVLDAAVGMHGAGQYGAQCGLVEGALMFLGLYGRRKGYKKKDVADKCYVLASRFEDEFGSISCKELRPEGFKPENPPHLCERLTVEAIVYTAAFVSEVYEVNNKKINMKKQTENKLV